MAEVKWIKITTDIFDDDKIKIIDKIPARDEILVIWFKLLALAGKVNQSGLLFLSNRIPYTVEMLAAVFNRDEQIVRLSLGVFEKYGMIHIESNEIIAISNWEKHQNVDGLQKVQEQTRERVKLHRERQKCLAENPKRNVTCSVTVTDGNGTERELDRESEREKESLKDIPIVEQSPTKESVPYQKIVDSFSKICVDLPVVKVITEARKKLIKARYKDVSMSLDVLESVFYKAQQSDFLTGRNGKWTACNFDWIMNLNNFVKIGEGNYDNKNGSGNVFADAMKNMSEKGDKVW